MSMELPILLGNYERPINQLTDQPTPTHRPMDMRVYREVTLPIIFISNFVERLFQTIHLLCWMARKATCFAFCSSRWACPWPAGGSLRPTYHQSWTYNQEFYKYLEPTAKILIKFLNLQSRVLEISWTYTKYSNKHLETTTKNWLKFLNLEPRF